MLEPNQLTARQVAEIIHEQFPGLPVSSVSYLGEGCDSVAFEVNSQLVFRFPKQDDVEQQLLLELRLLPLTTEYSPIPLPAFCFHGCPSVGFPRYFGGYPKLPGFPAIQLRPETTPFSNWAPILAGFLSWLHGFPVRTAEQMGVPRREVMSLIEEVRGDAIEDFGRLAKVAPDAPLEEWFVYLKGGLPSSARV